MIFNEDKDMTKLGEWWDVLRNVEDTDLWR